MHAAWTLLLARAPDSETATAAALAIAVLVFAPFAALAWDVEAEAVPYLALSVVFELGFFAMLGLALACGACIAGYTLSDSYGLRHAAPVPYLECVLVLTVLGYLPVMARLTGLALA